MENVVNEVEKNKQVQELVNHFLNFANNFDDTFKKKEEFGNIIASGKNSPTEFSLENWKISITGVVKNFVSDNKDAVKQKLQGELSEDFKRSCIVLFKLVKSSIDNTIPEDMSFLEAVNGFMEANKPQEKQQVVQNIFSDLEKTKNNSNPFNTVKNKPQEKQQVVQNIFSDLEKTKNNSNPFNTVKNKPQEKQLEIIQIEKDVENISLEFTEQEKEIFQAFSNVYGSDIKIKKFKILDKLNLYSSGNISQEDKKELEEIGGVRQLILLIYLYCAGKEIQLSETTPINERVSEIKLGKNQLDYVKIIEFLNDNMNSITSKDSKKQKMIIKRFSGLLKEIKKDKKQEQSKTEIISSPETIKVNSTDEMPPLILLHQQNNVTEDKNGNEGLFNKFKKLFRFKKSKIVVIPSNTTNEEGIPNLEPTMSTTSITKSNVNSTEEVENLDQAFVNFKNFFEGNEKKVPNDNNGIGLIKLKNISSEQEYIIKQLGKIFKNKKTVKKILESNERDNFKISFFKLASLMQKNKKFENINNKFVKLFNLTEKPNEITIEETSSKFGDFKLKKLGEINKKEEEKLQEKQNETTLKITEIEEKKPKEKEDYESLFNKEITKNNEVIKTYLASHEYVAKFFDDKQKDISKIEQTKLIEVGVFFIMSKILANTTDKKIEKIEEYFKSSTETSTSTSAQKPELDLDKIYKDDKFKSKWIENAPKKMLLPNPEPISEFTVKTSNRDNDIITTFGFISDEDKNYKTFNIINFTPNDLVFIRKQGLRKFIKETESENRCIGEQDILKEAAQYDEQKRLNAQKSVITIPEKTSITSPKQFFKKSSVSSIGTNLVNKRRSSIRSITVNSK